MCAYSTFVPKIFRLFTQNTLICLFGFIRVKSTSGDNIGIKHSVLSER